MSVLLISVLGLRAVMITGKPPYTLAGGRLVWTICIISPRKDQVLATSPTGLLVTNGPSRLWTATSSIIHGLVSLPSHRGYKDRCEEASRTNWSASNGTCAVFYLQGGVSQRRHIRVDLLGECWIVLSRGDASASAVHVNLLDDLVCLLAPVRSFFVAVAVVVASIYSLRTFNAAQSRDLNVAVQSWGAGKWSKLPVRSFQ